MGSFILLNLWVLDTPQCSLAYCLKRERKLIHLGPLDEHCPDGKFHSMCLCSKAVLVIQVRPLPGHFADRETPVLTGDSAGMASLFDLYLESSQEHLSACGKKPYVL